MQIVQCLFCGFKSKNTAGKANMDDRVIINLCIADIGKAHFFNHASTAHDRFQVWVKQGVFEHMWELELEQSRDKRERIVHDIPNYTARRWVAERTHSWMNRFQRLLILAIELNILGITVNNVAPGAIETSVNTRLLNDPEKLDTLLKNIPLKRLGQPGDVALLVAFLASSDADYVIGATSLWMVDCSGTIKNSK